MEWDERLSALLKDVEKFPFSYLHKFVGKNTPEFEAGVVDLRARFPDLQLVHRRESSGGKHVAYTFEWIARTPEEIIAVIQASAKLPDLQILL